MGLERVGGEGVVSVEEAKGTETSLEVVEGMQIDRGYLSPYFVKYYVGGSSGTYMFCQGHSLGVCPCGTMLHRQRPSVGDKHMWTRQVRQTRRLIGNLPAELRRWCLSAFGWRRLDLPELAMRRSVKDF